jgi:RNA polymerase sigma factor (sigma-70 family)
LEDLPLSRSRLYSLLSHVHRTQHADANGLPDAELLERFARLRDGAAFELLVWRHERMVLGVCRRLLRDEHDAEDAFQATFLTLARKAASIGRREAVVSWLYKVAYRCALRMRETVQRQRQGVGSGVDLANVAVTDPGLAAADDVDLRDILDEEVQRLPAKFRTAIVLCYLEGKSYQQAAKELSCPVGTLSARLHTARERLRVRLTARGIALAAALAVLESSRETHAAARLALVAVQAAQRIVAGQNAADVVSSRTLEIATGVVQAMSASKQKIIVIVMLMGCLSGLTSWTMLRALPQAPREQPANNADKPEGRPSAQPGAEAELTPERILEEALRTTEQVVCWRRSQRFRERQGIERSPTNSFKKPTKRWKRPPPGGTRVRKPSCWECEPPCSASPATARRPTRHSSKPCG